MNAYKPIKQGVAILITLTMLLVPVISISEEVVYPVSAYSPEELAKVRTWEKTWVGKKIDKSNIDEVAEFMMDSWVTIYKNPENWGAPPEGLYFHIRPYEQVIETKGMIEATKKYSPLVKTDQNGKIINTTEIAGFPFPNPKTGLEMAYNTEFQTRGDTWASNWRGAVIDPKSMTDRWSDQDTFDMYFIHRVDADPKPAILKNKKGYHKGQFMHINLPAENNNTRMINMKFIDESKAFNSYLFFAQFRRIQRLSAAERTNAIDGTDMIYDDGNMWDGYLSKNSYTYKGKKELLLGRHQDILSLTRKSGQAVPNGYTFERCNTYVVEVKHEDPDYIYSKRVWYIDPETYWIQAQEVYDELGRFWKTFIQPTGNWKTEKGEMKNISVANSFHDVQRTHSNFTRMKIKKISHEISPKEFLLSKLQATY